MNRLGLFIFYDKKGDIDDTVYLLLEEMQKYVTEIVVVCNGSITPRGRELLGEFSKKVIVRKHEDFDFYATLEGIEYIGWDNIGFYDEVVIFNSSIGGPVYSFKEMFTKMENSPVDFWGITKYYSKHNSYLDKYIPYEELPDYIQTYFYVIRKKLLTSREFKNHWYSVGNISNKYEAMGRHDAIFTKKFTDYGFESGVYIDTEEYRAITENPILWLPDVLITKLSCPVFLKDSLLASSYESDIKNTRGRVGRILLETLKSQGYNIQALLDMLLRNEKLYDIYKKYSFNKVFSNIGNDVLDKKVALIVHITDILMFNYLKDKILCFSDYLDVYLILDANKDDIMEEFKNNHAVRIFSIEGKDTDKIEEIIENIKSNKYEYIGNLLIECNKTYQFVLSEVEKNIYMLDNMLYSMAYINNIFNYLDSNNKVFGVEPLPYSRGFKNPIINPDWVRNYKVIERFSKSLGLCTDINKPASDNELKCFWCKADILIEFINFIREETIEHKLENIEIERVYVILLVLFAQSRGFYRIRAVNENNILDEYETLRYYFDRMTIKDKNINYWTAGNTNK